MSWFLVALLAAAVVVLTGAEWPRIATRLGAPARQRRQRSRRKAKANLRVIRTESDEFAASVERDLANLPTIEEGETKRR